MAQAIVKETLDVPAERVWARIADFGDASWFQGLSRVEVEGDGPGMARLMYADDNPPIREQLESLDADGRTLTYTIPENIPFPVSSYRATMVVSPSGPGACELEWRCECTPDGSSDSEVSAMIEQMYGVMIGWLRQSFA